MRDSIAADQRMSDSYLKNTQKKRKNDTFLFPSEICVAPGVNGEVWVPKTPLSL